MAAAALQAGKGAAPLQLDMLVQLASSSLCVLLPTLWLAWHTLL